MRKIWQILFTLIFILPSAFSTSVNGNFDVNTDCIYPAQTTWTLHNDSSSQQNYSITSSGKYSNWINSNGIWISKETLNITLPSNSRTNVFSFIKPTCDVQAGTYLIDVQFRGNDTITKTITVHVKDSIAITMDVSSTALKISQCNENSLTISLNNSGKTAESIGLGLEGIPYNWFDFNQSNFILDKNSQKSAILKIKVPCNALTKNYSLKIKASIAGTDVVLEKQSTLTVETSQNLSINLPKIKTCAETRSSEKISIKNNSGFKDSITLSLEGPSFISISNKNIDLNAGEQKELVLDISSTVPAKETAYKLKAVSKTFARTMYESSTIEELDCYNAEIESINVPAKLCLKNNGILGLSINNNGTNPISIKTSANGISTKPQNLDFNLVVGEKKPLNFEILTSNEKAGKKEFQITLKSSFFETARNYAIEFENCNDLSIDSNAFSGTVDINAGKNDARTIIASNNGTKSQNIKVSVKTAPSWAYIKPETAAVNSGKKAEFYLYISPPKDTENRNYKITLEFDSNNSIKITKEILVRVFGGVNADDSKPKIEFELKNFKIEDKNNAKTLNAMLEIKNTGLVLLKINSITVQDYNAIFEFDSNKTLNLNVPSDANADSINNSIDLNVSIALDSNFNSDKIVLPLKINTSAGTIEQSLEIDLKNNETFLAGLAVLADWRVVLTLGVIIAIILIALLLIAGKGKKENEKEHKSESSALKAIWEEKKEEETKEASKPAKTPSRTRKKSK